MWRLPVAMMVKQPTPSKSNESEDVQNTQDHAKTQKSTHVTRRPSPEYCHRPRDVLLCSHDEALTHPWLPQAKKLKRNSLMGHCLQHTGQLLVHCHWAVDSRHSMQISSGNSRASTPVASHHVLRALTHASACNWVGSARTAYESALYCAVAMRAASKRCRNAQFARTFCTSSLSVFEKSISVLARRHRIFGLLLRGLIHRLLLLRQVPGARAAEFLLARHDSSLVAVSTDSNV
jgi:hypothetical protein